VSRLLAAILKEGMLEKHGYHAAGHVSGLRLKDAHIPL